METCCDGVFLYRYDKPKTEVNTVYAMVVKPKSAKVRNE